MPRSPEADKIVFLGEVMFGPEWMGRFSRMTGISRPLLSLIASGDRAVTDAVRKKVSAGLRAEIRRQREMSDVVAKLLKEYEGK